VTDLSITVDKRQLLANPPEAPLAIPTEPSSKPFEVTADLNPRAEEVKL
jgi:hypothetical protein